MILLLACATPQRPLAEGERPNLVIVLGAAELPADAVSFPAARATSDGDAEERAAALTSRWPSDAGPVNTLAEVLRLYGYRAASTVRLVPPADEGFEVSTDAIAFADAGPEPFLVVTSTDDVPALRRALTDRGLSQRVVMAFLGKPSADLHVTLGFVHPGVPGRVVDDLASTMDLMPTLLAVANAAAPSDAQGRDLARPETAPTAVFAELRDDTLQAMDAGGCVGRRRQPSKGDVYMGYVCGQTSTRLEDEMDAWRARRAGKTAAEKVGAEALDAALEERGYW